MLYGVLLIVVAIKIPDSKIHEGFDQWPMGDTVLAILLLGWVVKKTGLNLPYRKTTFIVGLGLIIIPAIVIFYEQ
jgi:hypothetical protein